MGKTRFVTFYSYRGGLGRTSAICNTAWKAALCGKRVVVIDFDLEAPGIPFLIPFREHIESHKKNKVKKGGIFEVIQHFQKQKAIPSIPDFYATEPINFSDRSDSIFICYSKENQETAKKIYHDLKHQGFNPWIDTENILAGKNREIEAENAIKKCSYFLALLSSDSVSKRDFSQKQILMALDSYKQSPESQYIVIPIRIDDCTPRSELKQFQHVDLFPDYNEGLNKIIQSVKSGKGKKGGEIYIVPAGKEDRSYREKIQAFNWDKFYKEEGGNEFFYSLTRTIEFQFENPDLVLIDSRSGITTIGGICTLIIPDKVVFLSRLNDQHLTYSKLIIDEIEQYCKENRDKPIEIITVGTHVHHEREQDLMIKAKGMLRREIDVTFLYIPILSFEEKIFTQEHTDRENQYELLISRYQNLYDLIYATEQKKSPSSKLWFNV